MKFQVDSFSSLEDVAWTKIKNEVIKEQLLKKLWVTEFWFLYSTLLHKLFYQCMKFQIDSFCSLEVMAKTKIQIKKFPTKN